MTAKHIIFSGTVQGVGFRFTALRTANRYKLTGFVRNLPDGSVEMIAQGETGDIGHCIKDIKQHFGSYISEAKILDIPVNPKYKDFQISY